MTVLEEENCFAGMSTQMETYESFVKQFEYLKADSDRDASGKRVVAQPPPQMTQQAAREQLQQRLPPMGTSVVHPPSFYDDDIDDCEEDTDVEWVTPKAAKEPQEEDEFELAPGESMGMGYLLGSSPCNLHLDNFVEEGEEGEEKAPEAAREEELASTTAHEDDVSEPLPSVLEASAQVPKFTNKISPEDLPNVIREEEQIRTVADEFVENNSTQSAQQQPTHDESDEEVPIVFTENPSMGDDDAVLKFELDPDFDYDNVVLTPKWDVPPFAAPPGMPLPLDTVPYSTYTD